MNSYSLPKVGIRTTLKKSIAGGFWYATVLEDNDNASFAGVMQAFLEVLYAAMGAGQALADLSNVTKARVACRDMLALMDCKSLMNGLEPFGERRSVGDAKAAAR